MKPVPAAPVQFGIAGWIYDDWNDVVYPKSENDKLGFIASYLDCLEVNSTFYRIPSVKTTASWQRKIRSFPEVEMTYKLNRIFTHQNSYTKAEKDVYVQSLMPLLEAGHRTLLVQFPFYFEDNQTSRDQLKRISEDFHPFTLVLEIRHNSFDTDDARKFLKSCQYNVAFIDYPVSSTSYTNWENITGPVGYVRLHGRNYKTWFNAHAEGSQKYNYLYDSSELEDMVQRIRSILKVLEKVYVIGNNHYKGKAVCNMLELKARMEDRPVRVPPLLLKEYPHLSCIALPSDGESQLSMF